MTASRDRTRSVPVAILALLLAGCGPPRPTVTPSQPVPVGALARLQRDLTSVLSAPTLDRATWGVSVRSLDRDETLYAINERKLLIPASVMKVVTLAVAAKRLGWNYTFTTTVLGLGALDFGYLDGDLLVVGSGDPTLDDWDGAATQLFTNWADRLKLHGVSVVGGRLIGDDDTFDEERLGAGWAWDDLAAGYASGVGALQFNQNTARLTVLPNSVVGEPAQVSVTPAAAVTVHPSVITDHAGATPTMTVRRTPGRPGVAVDGAIPLGGDALSRNVSVDNPTLYYLTQLRNALLANGIEVRGPAVDIDDLRDRPRRADAVPLLIQPSPPLSTIAQTMMKDSQNTYAETVLRALSDPPGTVDAGRSAIREALKAWGVDDAALVIADGSGLSRYNLVTAESIVQVLVALRRDGLEPRFVETLPVAGVDGTLAARMKGTPAEGNARAKTGSLSNVRSLAGYVSTADGERLAFCILANHFGGAPEIVEQAADAVVIRLAAFTRRELP